MTGGDIIIVVGSFGILFISISTCLYCTGYIAKKFNLL
jgi:hypothetical protein